MLAVREVRQWCQVVHPQLDTADGSPGRCSDAGALRSQALSSQPMEECTLGQGEALNQTGLLINGVGSRNRPALALACRGEVSALGGSTDAVGAV